MVKLNDPATTFLSVDDLRSMFHIGRSKALLILDKVGHEKRKFYIGRSPYILLGDLMDYLAENNNCLVVSYND